MIWVRFVLRLLSGIAIVVGGSRGLRWFLENQFSIEISDQAYMYVYIVGFAVVYGWSLKRFERDKMKPRDGHRLG
jgi:hypothetical protein